MQKVMDTINDSLTNKLLRLESFLNQITEGILMIAEEIDHCNLKTAMTAVAVETKQCAEEICIQLHDLNVYIPPTNDQIWENIEGSITSQASSLKGAEVVALCNSLEIYYNNLYTDVLKECFPYKGLKDIITYQLYAIQCAFMKIRLLNTLRFDH